MIWYFSLVLGAVIVLGLLAGCASPGDVQDDLQGSENVAADAHRAAEQNLASAHNDYFADMASAEKWDVHVLGIPSSGWVAILIVVIVLLFGGSIALGVSMHDRALDRRRKSHELAMKHEETLRVAVVRGPCITCGTPPIPADEPGKKVNSR